MKNSGLFLFLLAIVSVFSMSGCILVPAAAAAGGMYIWDPSEEAIAKQAARALGTTPEKVTISELEKSGFYGGRYDFKAAVGKKQYSCYVTFTAGAMSDALCNNASGQAVTQSCNELLKAAGRC